METIVNSKGRFVIPCAIRKQLGIKEGIYLVFDVNIERRQIIVTPINRDFIHSLRGKYKGMGLMKKLMNEKGWEKDL